MIHRLIFAAFLGCDAGWQSTGVGPARGEVGELLAQHPRTTQAVAALLA